MVTKFGNVRGRVIKGQSLKIVELLAPEDRKFNSNFGNCYTIFLVQQKYCNDKGYDFLGIFINIGFFYLKNISSEIQNISVTKKN